MRAILLGLLFSILNLISNSIIAQNKVAVVEKNTNVLAKDLSHYLNATQDTLVLKSKKQMHYIYSVNNKDVREIDQFVEASELKIPVNHLSQGKHLFVVSYLQRKIVFVLRVYDPHTPYIVTKREEDVATRNN